MDNAPLVSMFEALRLGNSPQGIIYKLLDFFDLLNSLNIVKECVSFDFPGNMYSSDSTELSSSSSYGGPLNYHTTYQRPEEGI